jgi:dTDP-4-amino-4,6-dideoxygalactose transaminase
LIEIPLVDLSLQHQLIADEVTAGFADVMKSTAFIKGPVVGEFERAYAKWSGTAHCIGVGNGTDALELAVRACGVGRGDEVVLPANTFIASAEAVVRAGAVPVLADVDADHMLIDAASVASAVGPRTAAVMPVHLYGQMASMESLARIAEPAGLAVIEDAAQAHGATRDGRGAGGFGLAAGTSFYPGKNLGAYGDAGAVLTDDDAVARRVRLIADHGSDVRYRHELMGCNSRMDSFQAVVLLAKLAHLAEWNAQRQEAAARYSGMLVNVEGVSCPGVLQGNEHVWHLYVIRVADRDRVVEVMSEGGIGVGIHYPVPIHLQPALGHLGYSPGDFPVAEASAEQILSLPLYPGITAGQQERVVERLVEAVS